MTRCRTLVTTLAILAFLATPLALAPRAVAEDEIELTFPEPVDMEEFLHSVSRLTGKQLIWNPADKNIRGKQVLGGVSLRGDKADFMGMVRGLLTFYELVMIPVGPKDYQVTLVMDARQTSSILKLKPQHVILTDDNLAEFEKSDGLFITTTIGVEHMTDLRNARNALTRIVTGQNIGNVTEVPGTSTFVVTDFAPNVVSIYRLLKQMDRPNAGSSTTGGRLEAVTLRHATAADAASVLTRHFAAAAAPAVQGRTNAAAMPHPTAPRITADPRTNQVLVSGTDSQIARVREAIALLDVPVPSATNEAYLLALEHISPREAANSLNQLMHGSELWRSSGPRPARANVVPLDGKRAILVSASKEAIVLIRKLVEQMDTPDAEK
jgi:type II secretory pathway component GspD/PulD (secretin)